MKNNQSNKNNSSSLTISSKAVCLPPGAISNRFMPCNLNAPKTSRSTSNTSTFTTMQSPATSRSTNTFHTGIQTPSTGRLSCSYTPNKTNISQIRTHNDRFGFNFQSRTDLVAAGNRELRHGDIIGAHTHTGRYNIKPDGKVFTDTKGPVIKPKFG